MSRTKLQLKIATKLYKKPAGKLMPVDIKNNPDAPSWMTRCYMNNRYVVTIRDDAPMTNDIKATRAMVQRHDDTPIPNHWAEMQAIKNELFGTETTAIEYYPAEKQLMNCANIYWLWILPTEHLPLAIL
jgi:hypothetical protein